MNYSGAPSNLETGTILPPSRKLSSRSKSDVRSPKFVSLVLLLPILLLSCGAFWQTDAARATEMAERARVDAGRARDFAGIAAATPPSVWIEHPGTGTCTDA